MCRRQRLRSCPARPDLRSKLLKAFRGQTPGLQRALQQGVANGDATAISLAAHGLMSSGANVGEAEISACCRELEMAAQANDLARCAALLSAFEDAAAGNDHRLLDAASA